MGHLILCFGLTILLPVLMAIPAEPFFTTSSTTATTNTESGGGLVGQSVQMQTQGTIGPDGNPVGTTVIQSQDFGQNATAPVIQTSNFGPNINSCGPIDCPPGTSRCIRIRKTTPDKVNIVSRFVCADAKNAALRDNSTMALNPNPGVDIDSMSVNTIGANAFNGFDFQIPGLPSLPTLPTLPKLPSIVPSMPNFSNMFNNFPRPQLPNIPTPSLPTLPTLPTMPTMQVPQFPSFQSFSAFPTNAFSNFFDASRQLARSFFNPLGFN